MCGIHNHHYDTGTPITGQSSPRDHLLVNAMHHGTGQFSVQVAYKWRILQKKFVLGPFLNALYF